MKLTVLILVLITTWVDAMKHRTPVKASELVGLKSYNKWSDEKDSVHGPITEINIAQSEGITGLRLKYGSRWGRWHGSTGGKHKSLAIEDIISIGGMQFSKTDGVGRVMSIKFTISNGTTYGSYGTSPSNGTEYKREGAGCTLAFMSGYNDAVDWLLKVTGLVFHWNADC